VGENLRIWPTFLDVDVLSTLEDRRSADFQLLGGKRGSIYCRPQDASKTLLTVCKHNQCNMHTPRSYTMHYMH